MGHGSLRRKTRPTIVYGTTVSDNLYPLWLERCSDLLSYHLHKQVVMYTYRHVPWRKWFKAGWDVPRAVHECMKMCGLEPDCYEPERKADEPIYGEW